MSAYGTVALVLSGGSALGAYQAGAYQALHEFGLEPDLVAGASAGAINGAIICGNPPEQRMARLSEFWQPAPAGQRPGSGIQETARRTAAASMALATGRAGVFTPRLMFERLWETFLGREHGSLYDTSPLSATLDRLVDFARLNQGSPRFLATAVDMESGEDVVFDSEIVTITSEHLRASSALIPAFPPVEVEGRMLADAGLSANLPIDEILSQHPTGSLLCIALDLAPREAPRPASLGDITSRLQDLIFSSQSRRALAAWQTIFDERVANAGPNSTDRDLPSVTMLHLSYADQAEEVSGKAFDFSPETVRARWDAGHRDLANALEQLRAGKIETGRPGLTIYRPNRGSPDGPEIMRLARESLMPETG